jgi:hypothetical protein
VKPTNQIKFAVAVVAVFFIATTALGQVPRTLPKFVQGLSDEQYEAWAEWQNAQTLAREHITYEPKYLAGSRTTIKHARRGSGGIRTGSTWTRNQRRGFAHRGNNSFGTTTADRYTRTYPNPHYAGPPGATLYNPFVRPTGGVGKPDWDNLFVITADGVMTLTEALTMPMPPETAFRKLMEGFFE